MSSDSLAAFIPYPTNRVVGTIADGNSARAAVEALADAGFARDAIDVLHGEQDLLRLDATGEEHGFFARFQRTLIRTAAHRRRTMIRWRLRSATRMKCASRTS